VLFHLNQNTHRGGISTTPCSLQTSDEESRAQTARKVNRPGHAKLSKSDL
jgi:hypothetical protein